MLLLLLLLLLLLQLLLFLCLYVFELLGSGRRLLAPLLLDLNCFSGSAGEWLHRAMSMVLLEASDIVMATGVTKEQRDLLLQHLVHQRLAHGIYSLHE
jgi:hypothetical protein